MPWERSPLHRYVGSYPFYYRVTCFTEAGDSPELEYVWDVDNSEFGVIRFRWGVTPD